MKPIAVLISDIHFTPATLELATEALNMAMATADRLIVPLIVAGDTLDSKAIIRGECANRLIEIFSRWEAVSAYVMVGNHDLINEKGSEHSLNFLKPYAMVIDGSGQYCPGVGYLLPYQSDPEKFREIISSQKAGSVIIAHQGVEEADMGHYVQDKTALPKEVFSNYRVISGHYHRAQDIKCGRPRKRSIGLFSYIGNPYTLSFGEADHGPKGFQILNDDGSLEFVPTNLRTHVVYQVGVKELELYDWPRVKEDLSDLIWLKVKGPQSELRKIKKKELGERLFGHSNYKLDLIPTDVVLKTQEVEDRSEGTILDALIDASGETVSEKTNLKALWREVLNEKA